MIQYQQGFYGHRTPIDMVDNDIDIFITVDQKLVNFNFNKYSIKSYKKLDDLNKSKILDYSLELS